MLTIIIMWLNSQVPSNWWYRTQNQILFPKSMTPSDHTNTINNLRRTWNTSVKCECTLETVVSSCVGVSISMSSACSPVSRVGGSHCVCLQYHGNKHEKNERYIFSHYNRWKVISSHWEIEQEGPEGPGTLTWDRRFFKFPFFIALSTTGNTWED